FFVDAEGGIRAFHVTGVQTWALPILAGNIGLPLLELLDVAPADAPDCWVIELSSYQTGDVAASGVRPDIALVLNVFPEHLDWHESGRASCRVMGAISIARAPMHTKIE